MYNKSKRIMFLAIAVLLVAVLVVGCGQRDAVEPEPTMDFEAFRASVDANQVIAELEGTTLTYGEMFEQLEAEDILQPGIADYAVEDMDMLAGYAEQLVIRKQIFEEAETAGFQYDQTVLDEEMQNVLAQYPDLTEQEQAKLRSLLNHYITITEYLNDQVSEEDARAFYEENPGEFTTASVRHILIAFEGRSEEEALELANSLTERIRAGEDMAELAEEYTEDPGSQDAGGLYENQPVMLWVPEFKEAALTFELNTVGDPVRTEFGYHVMRVEERNVTAFEQVEGMIKDSRASEVFMEYLDAAQGKVTVNL
ncbi:peptidylprolyl isomerase [Desulfuribacillus alkaliarsenatis]|uniref:PpiC domain-containing protein n=1 Tax=Desulfuribacillus alkaliarsenatis TaxID=766136 RepID=A0A1E5FYZ6_9FIRM|nr:peptidylprolyl isomerase [Desulfuribacillus alkaliarsenatis]OEF95758.1 hypothetical protein BHF68_11715 [Desulfuribacillus alkaliarsenatis]